MGLFFAVLASVSFVALDVLRKILGSRISASKVVIGINLGSAPIFAVFLFLNGGWEFDAVFLFIGIFEAIAFAITSVLYVQAVSLSPLSLTIPYLSLTPVISLLVAIFTIGEIPTPKGLLGVSLVVVGAFALHLGKGCDLKTLIRAPFKEPGSWRMILVASVWGFTTSLDKIAIQHGSEALLGLFLTLGSALILICLRSHPLGLVKGETSSTDKIYQQPLLYLAALAAGIAVLAQFYAYRHFLVAYVESVKRAGGLLSVLLGILFFGEEGFVYRIPAAIIILTGAILVLN